MLINGSAKDPDGSPIIVAEEEIIGVLEQILDEHSKKGERSDTIICWTLTTLSKLSIRLKQSKVKIAEIVSKYTDHMNVEI